MFHKVIVLWLTLVLAFLSNGETNGNLRVLSDLQRALDDEHARADAFSVEGTVIVPSDTIGDEMTVTDGKTYLRLTDGLRPHVHWLKAGDYIRATGHVIRQDDNLYNYAKAFQIEVLGRHPVPPPTPAHATDIVSGKFRNRIVSLNGLLIDIFRDEIDPRFIISVVLDHGSYAYLASYTTNDLSAISSLIGSTVQVTGICYQNRPGRNRSHLEYVIGVTFPSGFEIIRPARSNSYDVPELRGSIQDILTSTDGEMPWRKVRGSVLAVFRRNQALVRTEANDISHLVFTAENLPTCGMTIEAVGMPETDFYHLNLSRATWRKTDKFHTTTDITTNITAAGLLKDESGRRMIKPKFYGRPVHLRGLVTHVALDTTDGTRLTLDDNGTEIPVEFGSGVPSPKGLERGCEIEVTGICFMETDNWRPQLPFPRIRNVSIIVRETADLRILRFPPWWTVRRLLNVIGILVAAIVGILVWNVLLQRLSDRKGRALARARLASSENLLKVQERTRLATELHDTIVQNLTGASMELRTASRSYDTDRETSKEQLRLALKTLDSCRNEIRNCIWDLRSRALDETNMDAAIRRTLAPFEGDAKLSVRFAVPRERLTDNTAHALICIVRELVINATRHGKAKTIRIAGCLEYEKLLFSVQDDGCGFDPKVSPGVGQGHFGLQGIQERIDALRGKMSVTSAIGKGAHVTFAVPLASEGKN